MDTTTKDRNSLAELDRDLAFLGELQDDLQAAENGDGVSYRALAEKLDDWRDELEKMRGATAQQMAALTAPTSDKS